LPAKTQDAIVGTRRAELLRAGELKWSEITDKATGELRTLDDLGFTLSGKKKD
jgi:hypothetical protein